jgi:hypothetical protein
MYHKEYFYMGAEMQHHVAKVQVLEMGKQLKA